MRTKNLILGLACLFVLMVVLSMSTKSQKPGQQPEFEVIEIGTGGSPRWSPDGTRLAFMSGGWLCVANADGKGETKKVAKIGINSLDWMSDSVLVFSENIPWTPDGKSRGHKLAIRSVDMEGQIQTIREDSIIVVPKSEYLTYASTPIVLRDGTVGYYEIHEKPGGETRIFRIIKEGSLKPGVALKQMQTAGEGLESIDGTIKKKIPFDRKYYYLRLSPDGTKIIAHHYGVGIAIIDTSGNAIVDFYAQLPKVEPGKIADIVSANWSPNSKKIVYDLKVESEDTTFLRDIYIANFDGSGKVKIPDIPGELIGAPGWSPDGTRIVCISESGKIYVIKLK